MVVVVVKERVDRSDDRFGVLFAEMFSCDCVGAFLSSAASSMGSGGAGRSARGLLPRMVLRCIGLGGETGDGEIEGSFSLNSDASSE